jgi:hypothetical protein
MLIVETIAKIRRAFFVQGKSIKLICRELSVSRKVVRKVIRSDATEFRYEREAQPLPKIGPWTDQLDELLLANEGKAARERLTLLRLFEELRGRGRPRQTCAKLEIAFWDYLGDRLAEPDSSLPVGARGCGCARGCAFCAPNCQASLPDALTCSR